MRPRLFPTRRSPIHKYVLFAKVLRRGHSGKYELVVPSTELGDQFNTLLNALWNALLPIIADAEQSQSHPSVAYRTFFKDKANAPFVAQLLRNVTIGNAMYPPMPPDSSGSPTLIYVDENTPPVKFESPSKPTKDAHAICMAGESEGVAAFVATRLPYIIICPDFFNSRPALPSSKSCPRITSQGTAFQRNKRLEPDYAGQRMMESQIWILLEEIVHYYLDFHWPTVQGPEPEVRDINRAWGLDAALSLGNAQSYAYYAASKTLSLIQRADDRV